MTRLTWLSSMPCLQNPCQSSSHLTVVIRSCSQQSGLDQEPGDDIGVEVGGRPAVLVVAALLDRDRAAHAHRGTTVGHAPSELVHAGSLVLAGQAALIAGSVPSQMHCMLLLQLLDLLLDGIPAGACSIMHMSSGMPCIDLHHEELLDLIEYLFGA